MTVTINTDPYATERQIPFLRRLATEREIPSDARERLLGRLATHERAVERDEEEGRILKNEAREFIDWLLKRRLREGYVPDRVAAMPKKAVRQRNTSEERKTNSATVNMRRDPNTLLKHGVFSLSNEVYMIVPTRTPGRFMAKRYVKTPERLTSSGVTVKFDWVDAPGVIWALYEQHRLPVADIEAMLIEHRVCIYPGCYRKLKAANSVRAGAGKRHCERMGIPWKVK